MAALTDRQVKITGTTIPLGAASAGGDTVKPGDRRIVLVRNGGGSPINVTIVVPGNDKYGNARPDIVRAVAAGAVEAFGPFPADLADSVDGLIDITYSGVTSVTVDALTV
jgi:hypothetical protein